MRAVKNREIVLRLRVDDEGGSLVSADTTPELTVATWAGTAVGGVSAVTEESTGVYRAVIPPQADLDRLVANWSYAVSGVDRLHTEHIVVVGGITIPLWRLREDAELASLSVPAIQRLATLVDDWLRDALGYPVVEEPFDVTYRLPRPTNGLRVPGVPFPMTVTYLRHGTHVFSDAELADLRIVDGAIERGAATGGSFLTGVSHGFGWNDDDTVVHVRGTHGPRADWGGVVPEDLVRAATILARYTARANNYPERARQVATDGALITLSTPAHDRPTGLPDVDGVLARYRVEPSV